MRLTILTLAHDVYTSEPGGLLNITGIYTGLASSVFPFTVPKMLLVARFTGSPAEYGREFDLTVTFTDEEGLPGPIATERKSLRMVIGQSGEDVHSTYIQTIHNTTFTQPGWYQFALLVNGEWMDDLPVNIARSVRR